MIGEGPFTTTEWGTPVDDARIVELFWERDEAALAEIESKYGRYCLSVANGILHDAEDAKE